MKSKLFHRLPALALSAVMLASSFSAVSAADEVGAILDPQSPYITSGEYVLLDKPSTPRDVLTHILNKKDVKVVDRDGNELTSTDAIGSLARVSASGGDLTLVLPGDVNGDAKINAKDVIAVLRSLVGKSDVLKCAADIDRNDAVNVKDVISIMRYIVGYNEAIFPTAALEAAENDDPTITLTFDSVLHRASRSNTSPSDKQTYTAYLAKNEIEDVQFFLVAENSADGYTLELSELKNAAGHTLPVELRYVYYFEECYYKSGGVRNEPGKDYPDPIPLYTGESIKLDAGESRAFVIQTNTLDTTVDSGMYHGTITLRDADGREVKRAAYNVYVWDFELDARTWCETTVGLSGYPTPEYLERYELFRDYRIAPYSLPYDIMDDRADEYMSDPRVSSFSVCIEGYGGVYHRSESEVLECYDKLRTNEEWLRKAYLYPVDEPWKEEHFEKLKNYWNRMCELMPQMDWEIITPVSSNPFDNETKLDRMALVIPYCTILCPQIYAYRDYVPFSQIKENLDYYKDWQFYLNWQDARSFPYFGNYSDRAAKLVAEGTHRAWWYSCDAPGTGPMCDFYIDFQGSRHRLFFWQQYANDIDGFLYWATNMMTNDEGRRVTAQKVTAGDGLWVYTAADWLPQSVVPGLRLESIRDGIEDFQYFTQLENLMGSRDAAMEYVSRIITNIHVYDENFDNIEGVRRDLGFYLEELYNK